MTAPDPLADVFPGTEDAPLPVVQPRWKPASAEGSEG